MLIQLIRLVCLDDERSIVNAGDPDYVPVLELTDMDGDARISYGRVDMGYDEVVPIGGDLEADGDIDIADFGGVVGYWLNGCAEPDWCGDADIDKSGTVDIADLLILARRWLWGVGQ